MLPTIWGDDDRFRHHWSRFRPRALLPVTAKKDETATSVLAGRSHERLRPPPVDHRDRVRPGSHPKWGRRVWRYEDTGQAVCVRSSSCATRQETGDDIVAELRQHVTEEIGPIATRGRS